MSKDLEIYSDGAARGNPGPAAAGFVLVKDKDIIKSGSQFLGRLTNNSAEYKALILALQIATNYTTSKIKVFSDSQLMIRQLKNVYKVRKKHLRKYYNQIKELEKKFKSVKFSHVNREHPFIQECDRLCNERLDRKVSEG